MLRNQSVRVALAAALAATLSAGCGSETKSTGATTSAGGSAAAAGADSEETAGSPAAGEPASGGAGGACTSPNARGRTQSDPRWCRVDEVLAQALAAPASLPGFTLIVNQTTESGQAITEYEGSGGTLRSSTLREVPAAPDVSVISASAAKLLTSLTILRSKALLAGSAAAFSLETRAETLGCTGLSAEASAITLGQLLHQIAGLSEQDEACVSAKTPLGDCACTILKNDLSHGPPGTHFAYGGNSFAVAAAIADAALNRAKPARSLTDVVDQLASEVGAPDNSVVRTASNQWAGLYLVTAEGYAKVMSLAVPGPGLGMSSGQQLIDPADLEALATPYGDEVSTAYSPFVALGGPDFRYGLGSWVDCTAAWSTPETWPDGVLDTPLDYASCPAKVVHSAGKFGFMPWIAFPRSAAERGHYAVLATYKNEPRAAADSFLVFQMLEPLLHEILEQ